jgi:hypothetical protein
MQGSGWLSVLSRIPAQKHDCLIIVTNTGAEIVLREIVRVENDFMILRGRMAGSTDEGRVIIMPFDQVTYFAFNKMMPEAELQAMFGKSASTVKWLTVEPPPGADSAIAAAPPAEQPETGPFAQGETAPTGAQGADAPRSDGDAAHPAGPAPAGGKVPPKPGHPSKSLLLARLRARLANEGGNPLPR